MKWFLMSSLPFATSDGCMNQETKKAYNVNNVSLDAYNLALLATNDRYW